MHDRRRVQQYRLVFNRAAVVYPRHLSFLPYNSCRAQRVHGATYGARGPNHLRTDPILSVGHCALVEHCSLLFVVDRAVAV